MSALVRGHMRGRGGGERRRRERESAGKGEVPGAPRIVPLYIYNRLFGEASQPVNCPIHTKLTRLCLSEA